MSSPAPSSPIPIPGAPSTPTISSGPNPFTFVQINVADLGRSEAFFRAVFGWHFIGSADSPPRRDVENAIPLDFNYFTAAKHDLSIIGGLLLSAPKRGEGDKEDGKEGGKGEDGSKGEGVGVEDGRKGEGVNVKDGIDDDAKGEEVRAEDGANGKDGAKDDSDEGDDAWDRLEDHEGKSDSDCLAGSNDTDAVMVEGVETAEAEGREENGAPFPGSLETVVQPPVVAYVSVECIEDTLLRVESAGGRVIQKQTALEKRIADLALFSDLDGNVIGLVHDNCLARAD